MPIYDNNGTTSYEIGKLYDHNGTSATQIGAVYDNNGTTSSLIYKAEEEVSVSSGVSMYKNTTGLGTQTYSNLTAEDSNTSGGYVIRYKAVTVTDWDTLTVKWTAQSGTYGIVYVGVKSTVTDNPLDGTNNSISTFAEGTKVSKTSTQTTTVNVSSRTGTIYLEILVSARSSVDAVAKASITSAVLS